MRLRWHNVSGPGGAHLMIGGIYIGHVARMFPENYMALINAVGDERRRWYEANSSKPWFGWLMTDDEGREVGKYATQKAAMEAIEAEARRLLGNETN